LFTVYAVALSCMKCPYNFSLSVIWAKKGDRNSLALMFRIYCFMKKHGSGFPPHPNCIPNPNLLIMQWRFMNSMRIFCTPSVILALYIIT
jgi:hypothetical protein